MSKKGNDIFMFDENVAMTKLPSTPKLCKETIEKTYKESNKVSKEESKEESKEGENIDKITKQVSKEIDDDPFFFF